MDKLKMKYARFSWIYIHVAKVITPTIAAFILELRVGTTKDMTKYIVPDTIFLSLNKSFNPKEAVLKADTNDVVSTAIMNARMKNFSHVTIDNTHEEIHVSITHDKKGNIINPMNAEVELEFSTCRNYLARKMLELANAHRFKIHTALQMEVLESTLDIHADERIIHSKDTNVNNIERIDKYLCQGINKIMSEFNPTQEDIDNDVNDDTVTTFDTSSGSSRTTEMTEEEINESRKKPKLKPIEEILIKETTAKAINFEMIVSDDETVVEINVKVPELEKVSRLRLDTNNDYVISTVPFDDRPYEEETIYVEGSNMIKVYGIIDRFFNQINEYANYHKYDVSSTFPLWLSDKIIFDGQEAAEMMRKGLDKIIRKNRHKHMLSDNPKVSLISMGIEKDSKISLNDSYYEKSYRAMIYRTHKDGVDTPLELRVICRALPDATGHMTSVGSSYSIIKEGSIVYAKDINFSEPISKYEVAQFTNKFTGEVGRYLASIDKLVDVREIERVFIENKYIGKRRLRGFFDASGFLSLRVSTEILSLRVSTEIGRIKKDYLKTVAEMNTKREEMVKNG